MNDGMNQNQTNAKQNRFKSWALWLSIAALIVYVVKTIWGIDLGKTVDDFMGYLLPVLIGFGIVNNPTDKKAI